MKWSNLFYLFVIKPDNTLFDNKIRSVFQPNSPNLDNWHIMRTINANRSENQTYIKWGDGFDHRPIVEETSMYNITQNFLKMKLLRRLENNLVPESEKLNSIIENEWLLNNDSKYLTNLLAGDLINHW